MVIIVNHVTLKDDEGTVVKTGEGIEQDIKELLKCGIWIVVSYSVWWHLQRSLDNQWGFNKN